MLRLATILYCLVTGAFNMPTSHEEVSKDTSWGNAWERGGQYHSDIILDDRDGIRPRNVLRRGWWPDGIVPYTIDPVFGPDQIEVIEAAMHTLEDTVTNNGSCQLRFVPLDQQSDFINFIPGGVWQCWSYFGMIGGPQILKLGPECFQVHVIVHELMHSLGFAHQHASPNRDDYVEIHSQNIIEGREYDFGKEDYYNFTDFGLPYDYDSIMHYSPYAVAKVDEYKHPIGPTISARDPNVQLKENKEISEIDKIKLQLMYCKHPNN